MATALWLAVAVLATPVSMGLFARTQQRMLRAGGTQVPMRRMIELVYAANAVNWTMPGGTALSAGYVTDSCAGGVPPRPARGSPWQRPGCSVR